MTRLLIDCGLPFKQLEERLVRRGVCLTDIDAAFVTHEHSDHVGCARQLAQQESIPILMSRGTYVAIGQPDMNHQLQLVSDGTDVTIKDLVVCPFTVAHDAKEPLQVMVTDGQIKFGLLTDLGHTTPYVAECLISLDAIVIECNHDPEMLRASQYPSFLKQRVAGNYGHLSNAQAADFLQIIAHPRLKHVVAAHLSLQNNHPKLAQKALAAVLNTAEGDILVADATDGCDWLAI